MESIIIINNQEVSFGIKDRSVFTDSLTIAKIFGKEH
jgi:phage regulator Rha-like protein